MPENEPIRLTTDDLYTPKVEAFVEEQALQRRPIPETPPRPWFVRVFFANWFYLGIAASLGAFVAWAIFEPFITDFGKDEDDIISSILLFPTVAAFAGMFLGAAEGLMCRNLSRSFISAAVGLGVGFGGGLIAVIPTGIVFVLSVQLAVAFWKDPQPNQMPSGFALLLFMMGRGMAWSLAAIPAGIGQGIAIKEKRVVWIGLLGAVLGGLLGGLLFDPIDLLFRQPDQEAWLSRLVGFMTIGGAVGACVGLVENLAKTAWLFMKAGPLAGKQFIIYRDPTVLGSSPKADIYLFKDAAIEPRHALIHNRGGRYEIEDLGTPDGTYVNGIPIKKKLLQTGDTIVLGETVLEFSVKSTS